MNSEVKGAMMQLVVDIDAAESKKLPLAALESDTPRMAGALLLALSGEITVDVEDPKSMTLTAKGQWLRQGIFVVTNN